MTNKIETPEAFRGDVYQIRIQGQLGAHWSDWFEGLTVTPQANGGSLLSGPVADQAALHGLLRKLRDLALPLISVIRLEPASGQPGAGQSHSAESAQFINQMISNDMQW